MYFIIPSLIAHDQQELDQRLQKITLLKPAWIQLDVMDGSFVPHTSLEFDIILPKKNKYETHLMVQNPRAWFIKNHAMLHSVIVHYESKVHIHEMIKLARKYKKKIGVAINPETPSDDVHQYLNLIDKVLVMTVQPGKYGSRFIPAMQNKIKHLHELAPRLPIQVDGGINPKTLAICKAAGASEFVVGSYIQKARNVKKAWHELDKALGVK